MSFEVPEHIRPLRARVRQFIEERIYPPGHHGAAYNAQSALLINQVQFEFLDQAIGGKRE